MLFIDLENEFYFDWNFSEISESWGSVSDEI